MKEKMKQNKKYVAIFCVVFMLFSLISMSAFAYTDTSTNGIDFTDQPYSYDDYHSMSSQVVIGYSGTSPYGLYFRTENEFYCFTVTNGSSFKVYVISDQGGAGQLVFNNSGSGFTCDTRIQSSDYYYSQATNTYLSYMDSTLMPNFSTYQDGLNAFIDWIENPPSSGGTSYSLNISLPAGNILIAQTGGISDNHYYLETTGGTTGATVKPGLNNIQTGYYNSLPSSFTLPSNSLSYPPYWVGTGKQSIFGTYNRQCYGSTVDSSYTYFVVGNPMYPNDNSAEGGRLNAALTVQIDNVITYKVIDLKTGYVSGILTGTNDGSSYIDYHYDENSRQWVGINQNGVEADPVLGGQNDYMNTPSTVNDWLENIAHQISNFFTGAIGAASTLINAGRDFFNVLTGLYSWLPPAVFSVLSSALIIIITIGVIKAFI